MTFKEVIDSLPKQTVSVRNQKINEIAAACRVDPSAVYNWLAGRTKVRPIYRGIIAKHLGMPESELFPEP